MSDYFIIMENEPSIEDLRAEIIDYKKQIENQTTIIENLNKDIGQLKQKNYDLFMQVSNNPQEPPKNQEKEVISLDTIINNLRGEN